MVLAAPGGLAPLAELTGAIDELVDAAPLAPLDRRLHRAALAVNLHGRGPQSHRVLLATRPLELIAFDHPKVPESRGMPRWRADEHEVRRWCRLLEESGVATDPAALDLPPPEPRPPAVSAAGATLIHPGAASGARRWPPERFAAVARTEHEAGRPVVVTGSSSEVVLARRVGAEAGLADAAVLAGRTDLLGLAGAVATAARVLCGDTGVAHLATALGTPSVVLFGPTSPALWGPPPDRPWHRALWAGRTGDPHAPEPGRGLLDIGVEAVISALAGLPENPARGGPRPFAATGTR